MSRNHLTLKESERTSDDVANYYLSALAKDKTPFESYNEQDLRRRTIRRAELCLRKYEQANQLRNMQNTNAAVRALHNVLGTRRSA
jgi:hypothetical protein